MKRNDTRAVGEILRDIFQDTVHQTKLREAQAIHLWEKLAGMRLAGLCGKPSVRNGVMSISVKSAALRHELWISRSSMINLINNNLGSTVITEIRYTS